MRTSQPPPDASKDAMQIMEEFRRAYADCMIADMSDEDWREAVQVRQLTWKASHDLPLAAAVRCFDQMACNYNEFEPAMIAELARAFPDAGITLTPAREYSVAIYVHVPNARGLRQRVQRFAAEHFHADEISWENEETLRCWWD